MKKKTSTNDAAVCRWIARLVGTLLLILTVYIAIGQRMPNLFTQPAGVQVGFLALAFILIGILAGWRWELASLLAISILLSGCIYSLRPGPHIVRLRLDTKTPELYRIRLPSGEPREFSLDAQGRVSFTLSPVRQGRDWYWFGIGRLRDGSGWGDPVIHVLREGRVVRKLSLSEINKLPVAAPADSLLKLE